MKRSENKSTDSTVSNTAVEATECSENYATSFWERLLKVLNFQQGSIHMCISMFWSKQYVYKCWL